MNEIKKNQKRHLLLWDGGSTQKAVLSTIGTRYINQLQRRTYSFLHIEGAEHGGCDNVYTRQVDCCA